MSLMYKLMLCIKFGFFFWTLFLQIFSLPLSPSLLILGIWVCWYTWWCSWLYPFFSIHFPFCAADWIISRDVSFNLADSFFCCSNLLLIPSSEFFISVTILFSSAISIWFLSTILISLLIFHHYHTFLCSLNMVFT